MFYKYENEVYPEYDYQRMVAQIMSDHPELLDDNLSNFIGFSGEVEESQYGWCDECGKEILKENGWNGCCSARCWAVFYGEEY